MKVYIASSFSLIPKVLKVEKALEDAGFTVLCKWWTGLDHIVGEQQSLRNFGDVADPDSFYSQPACKTASDRDIAGVKEADFLVFVADDKPRAYNGANIELGIAIGADKTCFSVGVLENSALYHRVIKCKDIDDLLRRINSHSGINKHAGWRS